MGKLAVIAIGGNSLIKSKDQQTCEDQYDAAHETCKHIAALIEQGWNVAIGHGNGPQIGFIMRRSELAAHELHLVPMDLCGADTQGAIGYMLQQNLYNEFRARGIDRKAATVVTQVEVASDDPAFRNPSKPVGSFMDEVMAMERREKYGWEVVEDAGRGWRRVVASPLPMRVVELDAVKDLIAGGYVVITVGGGGIPVVSGANGELKGIAAVIDKDFASSLLSREIGADLFIISTAVEKVAVNFGKPDQKNLDTITVSEATRYMEEGHFAPGSMKPKIIASLEFLKAGGKEVIITNPENILRAVSGETGTHIVND
ncbi:MAG: carbamate kinase [Candidatus Wallbacteria bacterium HGW-Wallbacteria-1]|jgi:carbamate kinase|uniref:Carbamate kinase n=1 Tax=Candidatus Wallbacteria bacterium HGW-Wallbacteria-1 TaxID=2013854 RepID=A0A2N1PRV2_9BACT|nr:MAG: carbamate kinase [Candidatus Wallbacteria bacterium HGW-Wallbacteria-1]